MAGRIVADNDTRMRAVIQKAGVPANAMATTLQQEEAMPIRTALLAKSKLRDGMTDGIIVYPKTPRSSNQARLVFYVAAKEALLLGLRCYCLSLDRLGVAVGDDNPNSGYDNISAAKIIFVTDFYERGAAQPLSGWQSGVVRSWIRRKFESGGTVCVLSDMPLDRTEEWWPQSFTSFIAAYSQSYPI